MRRGWARLFCGTALGALTLLTACGGGGNSGAGLEKGDADGSASASTEAGDGGSAGGGSSTSTATATASSGRGTPIADGVVVVTPSGNILCAGLDGGSGYAASTVCLVWEHDYPIPDCGSQPGATFTIATDDVRGRLGGCASDLFTAPPVPVAYGDSLRLGPAVCDIAETGVTCTNDDGHGFWTSRGDFRLF